MSKAVDYMLIVYDNNMPKTPRNAKWKRIDRQAYRSLSEFEVSSVELEGVRHLIVDRRSFPFETFAGLTMVVMLDVRKIL